MNALIAIKQGRIGEATVQTVNARDLHEFLEVGTAFKDWIARRIAEYQFEDGRDFCSFLSESQGGRPAKEYALTLDMAKELAMVERNEKGKQARQYFIECERRAQEAANRDPVELLNDPAAMRGLLLTYSEKVLHLEGVVKEQQPKVEALDRIATANGSLCVTDAAKALQVQPKRLFRWLQENRWIYRRAGGTTWLGYQDRVMAGLLEHKVTTVMREDGSEKVVEQVRVTPKGLAKVAAALDERVAA